MELLDSAGASLAQATLDGTASALFTRTGLQPASYSYRLHYLGDSKFNPLTVTLPTINVRAWSTYTSVIVPKVICGNVFDVAVRVRTTDTTQAPPGQVTITMGSQSLTLTLVPTATPGESTATGQLSANPSYFYVDASYTPVGTFEQSSGYGYMPTIGGCQPIGLNATATATNRVQLVWNPTGASSYEIHRSDSSYGFSIVGYATTNSYLDTQVRQPHVQLSRTSGGRIDVRARDRHDVLLHR